jgi:hypothetical protein
MLALDANAFTYWLEAMNSAPHEPSGLLAGEKVALVRIFFWMPDGAVFRLVPTVKAECGAIADKSKLDDHASWAMTHVSQVRPLPDETLVVKRAEELKVFRVGENDRKIIAECELADIKALLTCDAKFIDRLKMQTRVWLVQPSEFWHWMRVSRGERPIRSPALGNPLLQCNWWKW